VPCYFAPASHAKIVVGRKQPLQGRPHQTDFSEVAFYIIINLFDVINKGLRVAGVGVMRPHPQWRHANKGSETVMTTQGSKMHVYQ
jgi:hypothetical protein